MEQQNKTPYFIKILLIIIGSCVAGFGLTLAVHMGFGVATLAVLWQGVAQKCHMSLGLSSFVVSIAMLLIVLPLDYKQIHIGTIIYQLVYSGSISVFERFLAQTPLVWCNVILMLVGLILLGVGMGMYAFANMGRGPYEALTFAICKKTNAQVRFVRMALDALCVVSGFLLGGKVGICTVFAILLIGPTIQKTVEVMEKMGQRDKK